MSSQGPSSEQGEFPLDWGRFPEPETLSPPDVQGAKPEWLLRLSPEDRRRVASLAWEQRPLVFLIDARARWNLVRPRLPLAGFDVLDFQDQPDGDFQIQVPSDISSRELQHLLKCLRQTRPPRSVVCERMSCTGRELGTLARREDPVEIDVPLASSPSVEKNS
ncbi:MAG: hypothetical protein NTX70_07880 [Verrucomicrobia bacterium]|nr:hypothetical protein [Verrucomicrobiota bacterium]